MEKSLKKGREMEERKKRKSKIKLILPGLLLLYNKFIELSGLQGSLEL